VDGKADTKEVEWLENEIKKYLGRTAKRTSSVIKEAKIARSTFYDLLNEKSIPKLDTACKIAKALEAPVSDVFPKLREV